MKGSLRLFDIEKARQKGLDEKTIAILEGINSNTQKRDSCSQHDFELQSLGRFRCKKCGCVEDGKYVMGYRDAFKHVSIMLEGRK